MVSTPNHTPLQGRSRDLAFRRNGHYPLPLVTVGAAIDATGSTKRPGKGCISARRHDFSAIQRHECVAEDPLSAQIGGRGQVRFAVGEDRELGRETASFADAWFVLQPQHVRPFSSWIPNSRFPQAPSNLCIRSATSRQAIWKPRFKDKRCRDVIDKPRGLESRRPMRHAHNGVPIQALRLLAIVKARLFRARPDSRKKGNDAASGSEETHALIFRTLFNLCNTGNDARPASAKQKHRYSEHPLIHVMRVDTRVPGR